MSEEIIVPVGLSKSEKYEILFPQVKALLDGEPDLIAAMASFCAALHHGMGFYWTGFYFVKDEMFVLGPFQGPVACLRFPVKNGVCGAALRQGGPLVVPDVDKFPGHIACSAISRSEIVVPVVHREGQTYVFDVDSEKYDFFDETDARYLTEFLSLLPA